MTIANDITVEASKAALPVGVGGAILFGISVNDWIIILTMGWLIWNYAEKLYSTWKKHVRKRNSTRSAPPRPGGGSDEAP